MNYYYYFGLLQAGLFTEVTSKAGKECFIFCSDLQKPDTQLTEFHNFLTKLLLQKLNLGLFVSLTNSIFN